MSIPSYDSVRGIPLLSNDEIMDRIDALLEPTTHPHVWLMFLDERSRQLPALMPYEVPVRAKLEHCAFFAELVREVGESVGARRAFLTFERPGSWVVTARDRRWLHTLREASLLSGFAFRGPFLAHDSGVCLVPPDDYADAVVDSEPA